MYTIPFVVVVTWEFNQWELVLGPATQNVKTRSPKDKLPGKAIDLGPLSPAHHFHLMPQFVVNKDDDQNFVSPFWCVPQAGEGVEPNMSRVVATHKISVQLKASDTPEHMDITLPLLKNHRKLKVGEVLSQGIPVETDARGAESEPASPSEQRIRW